MQKKEYSVEIGGKKISATFSDLADQASGSVIVKCGETSILATAVMSKKERSELDYFPLVVDYEEKFYAAGKILGGQFIRREGRPSDEAILTGRVIDRTIRPLFESHIRRDVQIVITALSIDEHNDPDILSVLGASLAIATSNIPWNGPVSGIRVVIDTNGETKINASYTEREGAKVDAVLCGKDGKINMIETEAKETSEDQMRIVFSKALEEIKKLEEFQRSIIREIGKEKTVIEKLRLPPEALALFDETIVPKADNALFSGAGNDKIHKLQDEWFKSFQEKFPEIHKGLASEHYDDLINNLLHQEAVEKDRRADGRKLDEVRNLSAVAGGLSAVLHGTGIFYRGGTHVLSVLTLGSPKDAQLLDGMEVREKKYFMHHYNFPPFSGGETGRMGGINRRAVGHGALAEKALRGILPSRDIFPYTIRLVSESMASNGSTSMASVCASSLAMMDGGVPITRPAAGIAIGLMLVDDSKYKILTDIQGPEDHHGDMDFKVAGTSEGITALQLDIKVGGITKEILGEALDKAKNARLQILKVITSVLPAPRPEIAPSAPKIITMKIDIEKIGAVIGPGGKIIKQITEDTGADIAIEQDGSVFITGKIEGAIKARDIIEGIAHEYKVGEKLQGKVVKIAEFGAFINIGPGVDGMVHVSEIAPFRVNNVRDILKEGDIVPIVVKEIDKERGRISLSIKGADKDYAEKKMNSPKA
ncbi:MAG: polyribonucleotide nucleotidyltransferase [Candidatus Vogelbacteria bacterium]|nr:polyribonucleotide nucleotidyltransferase [Candidatus Vogelbacteria bacterium]